MFSMFIAWRRAAVVAAIGGAAIAAPLAAVVPAQAAAPTVTIAAVASARSRGPRPTWVSCWHGTGKPR